MLTPDVGPGEVRIRVMAAGVSANDLLLVQGMTSPKPSLPFTPGSEVAGVIDAVGPGVQDIAVDDHVIALTSAGGFAEFVVVPSDAVVEIPEGMAYTTAAGFILTYAPAHHALKQRAALQAGETVLVLGAAGASGLAAIEVAKMLGARVIAAASTDEKLQLAKRFGADHRINYTDIDMREALKVLTDGAGVDVVFDPVGGEEAESALRSLALCGRHLIMGFAAGPVAPISPNALHARGAALIGVQWAPMRACTRMYRRTIWKSWWHGTRRASSSPRSVRCLPSIRGRRRSARRRIAAPWGVWCWTSAAASRS
ncbi:NADPH:quinone oxidoreductase family protein [Hankyongella ginsenosidimutans]|uniref:NADPH:quinone oxidoreductase family protein n=1 Tax=Hankyongella ginsenosidimutans TaxID=1763828 RepID=A0A4D7CBG2_9SPHN|nr:NADPH:quinone oxidoreductase family protein [Hankyongella ginsenosidimutans]QCI79546.1 NADPH:quinone oxidoreductase family protein [Hankyongella ginsenosidimutans]